MSAAAVEPAKTVRKKLTDAQKQALQELKAFLGEAQSERLKKHIVDGRQTKKVVREALEKGPATIPELVEATEIPSTQVLWQVAAMKKYGVLHETEVDGDYPRYELTPKS